MRKKVNDDLRIDALEPLVSLVAPTEELIRVLPELGLLQRQHFRGISDDLALYHMLQSKLTEPKAKLFIFKVSCWKQALLSVRNTVDFTGTLAAYRRFLIKSGGVKNGSDSVIVLKKPLATQKNYSGISISADETMHLDVILELMGIRKAGNSSQKSPSPQKPSPVKQESTVTGKIDNRQLKGIGSATSPSTRDSELTVLDESSIKQLSPSKRTKRPLPKQRSDVLVKILREDSDSFTVEDSKVPRCEDEGISGSFCGDEDAGGLSVGSSQGMADPPKVAVDAIFTDNSVSAHSILNSAMSSVPISTEDEQSLVHCEVVTNPHPPDTSLVLEGSRNADICKLDTGGLNSDVDRLVCTEDSQLDEDNALSLETAADESTSGSSPVSDRESLTSTPLGNEESVAAKELLNALVEMEGGEFQSPSETPLPSDDSDADVPSYRVPAELIRTRNRGRIEDPYTLGKVPVAESPNNELKSSSECGMDYCHLGCVCDSVTAVFIRVESCGSIECVFGCICEEQMVLRASTRPTSPAEEPVLVARPKRTVRLPNRISDMVTSYSKIEAAPTKDTDSTVKPLVKDGRSTSSTPVKEEKRQAIRAKRPSIMGDKKLSSRSKRAASKKSAAPKKLKAPSKKELLNKLKAVQKISPALKEWLKAHSTAESLSKSSIGVSSKISSKSGSSKPEKAKKLTKKSASSKNQRKTVVSRTVVSKRKISVLVEDSESETDNLDSKTSGCKRIELLLETSTTENENTETEFEKTPVKAIPPGHYAFKPVCSTNLPKTPDKHRTPQKISVVERTTQVTPGRFETSPTGSPEMFTIDDYQRSDEEPTENIEISPEMSFPTVSESPPPINSDSEDDAIVDNDPFRAKYMYRRSIKSAIDTMKCARVDCTDFMYSCARCKPVAEKYFIKNKWRARQNEKFAQWRDYVIEKSLVADENMTDKKESEVDNKSKKTSEFKSIDVYLNGKRVEIFSDCNWSSKRLKVYELIIQNMNVIGTVNKLVGWFSLEILGFNAGETGNTDVCKTVIIKDIRKCNTEKIGSAAVDTVPIFPNRVIAQKVVADALNHKVPAPVEAALPRFLSDSYECKESILDSDEGDSPPNSSRRPRQKKNVIGPRRRIVSRRLLQPNQSKIETSTVLSPLLPKAAFKPISVPFVSKTSPSNIPGLSSEILQCETENTNNNDSIESEHGRIEDRLSDAKVPCNIGSTLNSAFAAVGSRIGATNVSNIVHTAISKTESCTVLTSSSNTLTSHQSSASSESSLSSPKISNLPRHPSGDTTDEDYSDDEKSIEIPAPMRLLPTQMTSVNKKEDVSPELLASLEPCYTDIQREEELQSEKHKSDIKAVSNAVDPDDDDDAPTSSAQETAPVVDHSYFFESNALTAEDVADLYVGEDTTGTEKSPDSKITEAVLDQLNTLDPLAVSQSILTSSVTDLITTTTDALSNTNVELKIKQGESSASNLNRVISSWRDLNRQDNIDRQNSVNRYVANVPRICAVKRTAVPSHNKRPVTWSQLEEYKKYACATRVPKRNRSIASRRVVAVRKTPPMVLQPGIVVSDATFSQQRVLNDDDQPTQIISATIVPQKNSTPLFLEASSSIGSSLDSGAPNGVVRPCCHAAMSKLDGQLFQLLQGGSLTRTQKEKIGSSDIKLPCTLTQLLSQLSPGTRNNNTKQELSDELPDLRLLHIFFQHLLHLLEIEVDFHFFNWFLCLLVPRIKKANFIHENVKTFVARNYLTAHLPAFAQSCRQQTVIKSDTQTVTPMVGELVSYQARSLPYQLSSNTETTISYQGKPGQVSGKLQWRPLVKAPIH